MELKNFLINLQSFKLIKPKTKKNKNLTRVQYA